MIITVVLTKTPQRYAYKPKPQKKGMTEKQNRSMLNRVYITNNVCNLIGNEYMSVILRCVLIS